MDTKVFQENLNILNKPDDPTISESKFQKFGSSNHLKENFSAKTEPSSPVTSECNSVQEHERSPSSVQSGADSGFHSLASSVKDAPIEKRNEGTIGEGINFMANVDMVEIQRLELEKKRRILDEETKAKRLAEAEEKRLAREAYEAEIREKQYNRLMILLTKSKGFASFFKSKFETEKARPVAKNKTKKRALKVKEPKQESKEETSLRHSTRKRKSTQKSTEDEVPVKKTRESKTRQTKANPKINLSSDEIEKHLNSLSDEDADEEDADEEELTRDFIQPKYFEGELRDYQKAGVNWLKTLYENGVNGILADEMGLGKTIQVIALIAFLIEKKVPGPYMVVVPLSTLPNWISEFQRFAPKLPVVVYHGNKAEREQIKRQVSKKYTVTETFKTLPVVLMTYQTPLNDSAFLRTFTWTYIVVDEAQRIKNHNCLLKRIFDILRSSNRLLLTGTPLQNNLSELWSLLNFLLPEIFNDLSVFEAWFDAKQVQNDAGKQKFLKQEQEKNIISTLREILSPFMLRRIKEVVCPDIPPMKEVIVYAPLTEIQFDLYQAVIKRDLAVCYKTKDESLVVDIDGVRPKRRCVSKLDLEKVYQEHRIEAEQEDSNDYDIALLSSQAMSKKTVTKEDVEKWKEFTSVSDENIQYLISLPWGNTVMIYRHIVNHPYLVHYPLDYCNLPLIDENILKKSGKLLVLDAMLKKLKANGHKILLFATLRMVLDIIEDYLSLTNYKYVRLDGSSSLEDRRINIDAFNKDPEIFMFIMTTRAGSVGLNLAGADTVIIYDSDWNPQSDLQAMARCHRIGQTKPVVTYRLCTKGTIDEEIVKRAQAKRFLEKAVIKKQNDLDPKNQDGLQKLKKLLEDEEYEIVGSKLDVYTDEELDRILDRSDLIEQHKNIMKEVARKKMKEEQEMDE